MDSYDYDLPRHAIAQRPLPVRSAARLLVAANVSGSGAVEHRRVSDLPGLLQPGDLLVVNETSVLAARLHLARPSGGRAEVLLLEPEDAGADGADGSCPSPGAGARWKSRRWQALVRPGRRLPPGTQLFLDRSHRAGPWRGADIDPGGEGPVVEVGEPVRDGTDGRRWVRLLRPDLAERAGTMPLPPYIRTPLTDPDRYQTVYARRLAPEEQSVAAPTAGLHFTREVFQACRLSGASLATVNLAIGLDTFRPVTVDRADQHEIHTERFLVPPETLAACRAARRVVAVGTTVVRALESAAATGRLSGRTNLFIYGNYPFAVVDVLITNFHLPRSSLLLLVEAFYGPEWRELYALALAEGYRFLSFGDAMMIARTGTRQ